MEFVSTAVVVGIVAMLMLLGIGIVVNQLLRLQEVLEASAARTSARGRRPRTRSRPS